MGISKIIMIIMAVFFVLGALDRLIGNKIGMGAEFERAFGLMGPTTLSAVGFMVFAPVIANALDGILGPIFGLVGADTGMFPGILLSCEVAYPLAAELAADADVALFGGLVVGSVMGFIIGFTIPVACGLIRTEDYKTFSTGILAAYIVDPIACFIGGLAMGLPALTVLINLIPVIVISVIIILGLLFAPAGTIKVFRYFAKFLLAVITVGLSCAAVEAMTGFVIIPGMNPISDGFKTIGTIVLSLGGSLPLLFVLRKVLKKPLEKLGRVLGINDITALSLILAFTSLVPGYSQFKDMNPKGKVIYAAFSASAGCMLGCHIGFTSSVDQAVVMPMLLAKVIAGVLAIISALFFARRIFNKDELSIV